jgi:hypothetical protein
MPLFRQQNERDEHFESREALMVHSLTSEDNGRCAALDVGDVCQ